MNDSTNKDRQVPPPWGDEMESAMIARDTYLRSRVKADSSPHAAKRSRAGIVFLICATALLGFLLTLLLISYAFGYRPIKQTHTGGAPSIRKVR
jgi:hypothetical protein